MKKVLIISLLGTFMMGCSPEVKTVDYYLENEEFRSETLKKCAVTQGSHQDKNCMNASEAHRKAHFNKIIGK